jgi:uncharacterized membrane protein YebE (DUF533 family)
MDITQFLDQILQSGKDLAQKGQTMAEQKLGIPAEGEERDSALSGLKTGAAAAGALALLLGTQTGRKVGGAAVKVGSLAALGGLAYQMYRQWEDQSGAGQTVAEGEPAQLTAEPTKASPEVLLKAMIAAAKADGHVDSVEMDMIRQKLADAGMEEKLGDMVMDEMVSPLDAQDIAALAGDDKSVAAEIYVASAMIASGENEAGKVYLDDLKKALQLPDDVVAALQNPQATTPTA